LAVRAAAEDPGCTIYQAQIHEVYGMRAAG